MQLTDKITVLNEDCMTVMSRYPDKYFDLAVVDPPYGINFAKTYTGEGWVVREAKEWDKQSPPREYFVELRSCITSYALRELMSTIYFPKKVSAIQ